MRMDSRLSIGGFMLALAVMLTQARFIAKRETAQLDPAVASTSISTDPDMVTLARESGNVGAVNEAKGQVLGVTQEVITRLEDEAGIHKESLKTRPAEEGISVVNSFTDDKLDKEQPKPKEKETQLEKATEGSSKNKEAQPLTEGLTLIPKTQEQAPAQEVSSTTTKPKEVMESLATEEPPKQSEIPETTTGTPLSTTNENLLGKPVTLGIPSTTERAPNSTTRASEHGRSMQYSSTTEEAIQALAAVTPMKLRALPMTSTTKKTTTTSGLSSSTPSTFASNENAIEESTSKSEPGIRQLPEKRAKFISENSTNAQQLTLPNTAEVWSLAGMKAVPKAAPPPLITSTTVLPALNHTDLANDIEESGPQNRTEQQEQHQVKEKNLLDWQQIAMMENRTEFVVRTTLEATEGAMQATTEPLDEESYPKSETTQGLEGTTLGVTPTSAQGISPDEKPTTTTSRTELLDVPMVKKMSEVANAKLTEAQNKTKVTTEALNNIPVTEKPSTVAVTVRVALTKMEFPSITALADQMSALVNATTEEAATVQHASAEIDSEPAAAAVSEAVTLATMTTTTPKAALEVLTSTEARATFASTEATSTTSSEHVATSTTSAIPAATSTTAAAHAATSTTTATPAATSTTSAIPAATSTTSATPAATSATPTATTSSVSSETPDVDNTSNDVIVATTNTPESEQRATATTVAEPQPATAATTEATASAVSENLNGEVSTTTSTQRPGISVTGTSAIPITSSITGTSTRTSTLATPTPTAAATEVAQISNEVNLEAVTVKSASEHGQDLGSGPITAEKTDNAVNNSVAITESEPAAGTSSTTTTTGSPLSDLGKLSQEHESSLETNNIGEAPESTTAAAAAATSATDESTPTAAAAAAAAGAATGGQQVKEPLHHEGQQVAEEQDTEQQLAKTTMAVITSTSSTTETPSTTSRTSTTMQPPVISLLDDSTTTTTTTTTTTAAPATEEYTESPSISSSSSSSTTSNMLPLDTSTTTEMPPPTFMAPYPNELDHMQTNAQGNGTDVNVIIAITVSVIGVVALILLVAFLYLMRKRQKQTSYGQRCRPVSLDAYSLDNVSVLGSVRRKGRDVRASKRTYGNAAFDDPSLRHNLLTASELGRFVERRSDVFEEFRDVPQIIARADEVPPGCEDKNRYANVIPLPETRVVLQRQGDDDKTEYINANYVRGPRDAPNYYIACQAPLESTTSDFWRMIWEQQSRVIIQATDLSENGIEKCAEYLPPSATLDNHSSYGDYQVTLKHREVKDRYAISTLVLKRVDGEESRELTHYWYKWPEAGVPAEEAPIIAMLLEARSSLKSYCLEQANELREKSATLETSLDADAGGTKSEAGSTSSNEINGNISSRSAARNQQGPLTVHCSPGTGRTGTIIASDMAIRSLETPKRSVDIPQLVYYVRRGRASAVQTKEQYEFIYKVASMYAAKITNLSNDN
ncbi:hypothetical protein KR038_010335 [Drosophila bunnanda]|nr:hypothetical protein KR038_010335 [Drosophila bunnanda]